MVVRVCDLLAWGQWAVGACKEKPRPNRGVGVKRPPRSGGSGAAFAMGKGNVGENSQLLMICEDF